MIQRIELGFKTNPLVYDVNGEMKLLFRYSAIVGSVTEVTTSGERSAEGSASGSCDGAPHE